MNEVFPSVDEPRLIRLVTDGQKNVGWTFFRPGCQSGHYLDLRWKFNGDFDRPTFTPSLISNPDRPKRCHLTITDAQITYHGDSWHELKGKTISMEKF